MRTCFATCRERGWCAGASVTRRRSSCG
jgi:hypothetical protein